MICYIGLGSNLGSRKENLEKATELLSRHHKIRKASPIYQTPALVPAGAPADWNLAFLNAVLEVETNKSPFEVFDDLKQIEKNLGRVQSQRWAPRVIDLDLLLWGQEEIRTPQITVPHEGLWDRSFVLDPLKDLNPQLIPPGKSKTILQRSRELKGHAPLWMGILNLTPDSFSDGGGESELPGFLQKSREMIHSGVQVLDLGAESTRPGAIALTWQEEWSRLQIPLRELLSMNQSRILKPRISIDTRHVEVAEKALSLGADWINDVSGLSDPRMMELARQTGAPAVFMHSLSVPADKTLTLPVSEDPVLFLKNWALQRLEILEGQGIRHEQLYFDPGIGFGKTELQSVEILKRIKEFQELPIPVLVGHSRKSFMRLWTGEKPANRDGDSVGISLRLIESGVEVLRVHEPSLHIGAHLAWSHL